MLTKEFAEAFIKMQKELPRVTKGGDNPYFKSKYPRLEDVVNETLPIMQANGFAISQFLSHVEEKPAMKTILIYKTGEFIEDTCPLVMKSDLDPQAQGSAITYLARYSWSRVLGIVSDVDDDATKATMPPKENLKPIDTSAEKDAFLL